MDAPAYFTRSGSAVPSEKIHANDKGAPVHTYQDKCSRCGGAGGADKWKFTGWTCFDCGGSGKGRIVTERLYTAEKLAKLNAAEEKRNAKRIAAATLKSEAAAQAREITRTNFLASHKELVDDLTLCAPHDRFIESLKAGFEANGILSPGQIAWANTAIERVKAKLAAAAASQFVGEPGQRVELTLTVEHVIFLERSSYTFAPPNIYLCRDNRGNRVIYKGTGYFPRKGETATVKATVASHEVYKGENQTHISRPKYTPEEVN